MNVTRFYRILRPILWASRLDVTSFQIRRQASFTEHPNKTTVEFINDIANRDVTKMPPYVTKYNPGGFIINGLHIYGPVAILTRNLICWKVSSLEEMTPEAFCAFTLLEPPVDIVVVGTGNKLTRLKPEIHQYMKKHGILLEVQDTPHACATFNFLLEERRQVAAALLPVDDIDMFEDQS